MTNYILNLILSDFIKFDRTGMAHLQFTKIIVFFYHQSESSEFGNEFFFSDVAIRITQTFISNSRKNFFLNLGSNSIYIWKRPEQRGQRGQHKLVRACEIPDRLTSEQSR